MHPECVRPAATASLPVPEDPEGQAWPGLLALLVWGWDPTVSRAGRGGGGGRGPSRLARRFVNKDCPPSRLPSSPARLTSTRPAGAAPPRPSSRRHLVRPLSPHSVLNLMKNSADPLKVFVAAEPGGVRAERAEAPEAGVPVALPDVAWNPEPRPRRHLPALPAGPGRPRPASA